MVSAGVIRIVLALDIFGMALLAMLYLRQRRMSWSAYCFWGMIALLLPVFGPFLVISNRPGEKHPDPFPSAELRRRVIGYCVAAYDRAYAGLYTRLSAKYSQSVRWQSLEAKLTRPKPSSTPPLPRRKHPKRWI